MQKTSKQIFYKIHNNPSSQSNPLFLINIFGEKKKTSNYLERNQIISVFYGICHKEIRQLGQKLQLKLQMWEQKDKGEYNWIRLLKLLLERSKNRGLSVLCERINYLTNAFSRIYYHLFYFNIFGGKEKTSDYLINNSTFLFDSKIKSIQPKRIPKQNNPQKLYKSKFLTKRQQKSKQQIIRTKPIMNTLQRISKSNVFLLTNSSYCSYSNLVINIFDSKKASPSKSNVSLGVTMLNKKSDDYLQKPLNQKSNLDNAKNSISQLTIKPKIPIKIAIFPKLSFFNFLVIKPKIAVKGVRYNNTKNVLSNIKNCNEYQSYAISGIITSKTNCIDRIIITIIAKINDVMPNKLCFLISTINFTRILKLKHLIKISGYNSSSEGKNLRRNEHPTGENRAKGLSCF